MSNRVIHFEIHAEQPERAIQFYRQLLGWQFKKWEGPIPCWLAMTGPESERGIDGGLVPRRGPVDGQAVIAYVCTVGVEDLDGIIAKVTGLGGQIAVPKMAIPSVGWLAYAKDTEGNIFGLMQSDPAAK
jgi:uncharacterized protein